jgi:predicted nucleic acid-binding protein
MFLLDSNVYIHAFNNASFGDEFHDFHRRHLPRIILSVVVVHELLIGALTPARERSLRRGLIDPFKMRRRIHTPTQRTWELAATVDRRLRHMKRFKSSLSQRSFFNDILIAASARDLGATILTENEKDFSTIAEALDIRFSKPWP